MTEKLTEHIGRHSYYGSFSLLHNPEIYIGNFCSIGEKTRWHGATNHKINLVSTFPFKFWFKDKKSEGISKGLILIKNDVWIGDSVTFLSGVSLCSGAVIASNSVVTGYCRPYGVYAGNPARLKKYRFSDTIITELLYINWWDWPDELIKKRLDWFYKTPEEFIRLCKENQ